MAHFAGALTRKRAASLLATALFAAVGVLGVIATAHRAVLEEQALFPLSAESGEDNEYVTASGGGAAAAAAVVEAVEAAATVSAFSVAVSNEYGERPTASEAYPWLRNGALLVEPFRTTTLTASPVVAGGEEDVEEEGEGVEGGASAAVRRLARAARRAGRGLRAKSLSEEELGEASFTWSVTQKTNLPVVATTTEETEDATVTAVSAASTTHELSGRTVEHIFTSLGTFSLDLTVTTRAAVSAATASSAVSASATVICKYVRREIRRLRRADRDAYLDAFQTLMTVNSSEGVARYGAGYQPLDYFVKMHLNLAADRECDRMHDGMGFMTNHAALTSAFERGLQRVDPRVAMPYWDYTQDEYMFRTRYGAFGNGNDDKFWTMDDLWSDEAFGSAENSAHTVIAGRFAYQPVTRGADAWANAVHNSYGYLRAPWNVNKSPYVTRVHQLCGTSAFNFAGFPSCALHHNLTFGSGYESWYDWVWHASYNPHGPVHVAIGGTTNCAEQYDSLNGTLSRADLQRLRVFSYVTLKSGWRAKLVEMPKYCSDDTPQSECTPHCPNLKAAGEYQNITALEEMWAVLFQGARLWKGYSHEQKVAALTVVCTTPITPGDQVEASSPLDVSFWPIHPTMERLWAYKKLAREFTDQGWGNPNPESGPSRLCTNNGCKGHHADDVIPFDVMAVRVTDDATPAADGVAAATTDGSYEVAQLTNRELYAALDPRAARMPYVYDNFEWSHCDADGVHFSQDRIV